jgi:hypothetical protein
VLAGHPEPLPARGQDRGARTLGQHPPHDRADLVHQVLAGVQHDQRPPGPEPLDHRVGQRPWRPLDDAQRAGQRRHEEAGSDRDQVDEGPAARMVGRRRLGHHRGQARLADAPGSEQCDEAGLGHPFQDGVPVARAADERGRVARDAGEPAGGGGGQPRHRAGQLGQVPAVGRPELAQQRRDVALDGPHRDVQAVGDLGVGQVLPDGGQHLGLPWRDLRHVRLDMVPHPDPWWFRGGSVVGTDAGGRRRRQARRAGIPAGQR